MTTGVLIAVSEFYLPIENQVGRLMNSNDDYSQGIFR